MTEQDVPAADASDQASSPASSRASARGRKTVADLVRSLVVVLALVFVVVALAARPDSSEKVQRVDYSGTLAQARDTAPYDVLAPVALPDTWVPTSARTGREGGAVTWHLGMVTPRGDYAGVEQSDGRAEVLVASVADDAEAAGTVTIDGLRWRRLEGGSPEKRALVLEGDAVTTVVAGGASWAELEQLADALNAT